MFREKKTVFRFFLLSAVFIGGIFSAKAQVDTASLTGQVTDPQRAVIAGARVAATNQSTNIAVETTTNNDGYYTLNNLRPGLYTIEVAQANFKISSRKDYELNVGQKARLDLSLSVGDASAVVEVTTDNQAQLQREDASLGNVVDNLRVTTLPLPQRTWDDLLVQVAGTQADPYTEQTGGTTSGRTGAVNIHGVSSLNNNFILDGQDNNSVSTNVQELSTQVSRPSVDAIGEFKVITSQYSADTGRAAGGVISVTTKSGTNDVHGVAYEYVRNKVFDANDFFANKFGRAKPQRAQNQFGGNLGGPIWKNKAFFFADYEGTLIRLGQVRIATVPLASEKAGDFSGRLGEQVFFNGQPVPILNLDGTASGLFLRAGQIFDPRTQVLNPRFNTAQPASPLNPRFIRQAFAGNIISNIDPVAARLAALYPNPNQPGRGNNFVRTPSLKDDNNRFTTRLDYQLNGSNNMFGRYAYTARDRFVPGFFGGVADGTDTSAWGQNNIKSHSLTVGLNSTLSSTLVNQFRFGYSRSNADAVQEPFGEGSSGDFIPGIPDNETVQGGVPAILISGFGPRLGSADFHPKFQRSQQYQFTNTLSMTRGVHTFRFGTDIIAPVKLDYLDVPNTRGNLQFDGSYTGLAGGGTLRLANGTTNASTGNSVADFLVGTARTASLADTVVVNQRRHMYSFFGQDDWKVTPRLTLNLGLRYDFGSPAFEVNNRMANLDQELAAQARTPAAALASLRLASDGSLENRALTRPDRNNFAPRLGFAYSITDNTVIRGGFGTSYNLVDRLGSEDQLSLNPPLFVGYSFQSDTLNPALNFRTGFAPNVLDPANVDPSKVLLRTSNPEARTPYVHQASISLQHSFGRDYIAEVSYVTTRGRHLMTLRNLNQPTPGPKPSTINDANPLISIPARAAFFPFPAFGVIQYRDDNGYSNYNSLEATLDKRFSNGWTTRAVYTLSKSEDNDFSFGQNQTDFDAGFGASDFDVRHRFVLNGIYQLPFGGKGAYFKKGFGAALLGGWELSGSLNTRTGRPFTVTQSGDPLSLFGRSTTLPNLVGDPAISDRTVNRWFDPTAFQVLPAGSTDFGNAGRNILRGPGFASLDLGIHRKFSLGSETRFLDLRWELFNALNRANFGLPNRTINSSNVGTITTLAGDPRVMQFAARFNF
ncbi:MAG TPA: TonB-dependent receptor [Pyrinomonadaceae bacterium]|nr:TonB-dependent receptor [Pyrinomonadaceae bacterium]